MKMFKGKKSIVMTGKLVVDSLVINYQDETKAVILIDIKSFLPVYIVKRQKLVYHYINDEQMLYNIALSKEGHEVKVRVPVQDEDVLITNILEFENLTLKIGKVSVIEI